MCCFFLTLLFLGPRFAFLIYWLLRPAYFQLVFNTWIWPLLGLIFLPWTTLMWVIVYGSNGIVGFDWLWVGLALVADIATYTSGAYKRKTIPGYPASAP
jgi:hypothetical protein